MTINPRVLLVVVTYNSAEYITDCLASLARTEYPREFFDILVIDNCSTDATISMVKGGSPNVRVIQNDKNIGFAGANNIGFNIAISQGFDYVYLLNHDTVVDPKFITEALVVVEKDPRIGAVQSKLLLFENQQVLNSRGNMIQYLGFAFAGGYKENDRELDECEIAYPSGAASLWRVSALREIGLFHEEFFMYHEDTDLGWRLWLAGWRVLLAPKSVVYHKYEFSRSIKKYYYMERNRGLVILQNYKLATILLLSPMLLIMDVAMLFYSFINGWWKYKLSVYAYFTDPMVWAKIFSNRRMIQGTRTKKDSDVLSHFTGRIEFQDIANPIVSLIVNPALDMYWRLIRRIIWW